MLKSLLATCTGILLTATASAQSSPLSTEDIGDWREFKSSPVRDKACVNRWFNAQDLINGGDVLTVDILCETNQELYKNTPDFFRIRVVGMIASINRTQFNCQSGEIRNVSLEPQIRVYESGELRAVTEMPPIGVVAEPETVLLTQTIWESVENEYNFPWNQPKSQVYQTMRDELCDRASN